MKNIFLNLIIIFFIATGCTLINQENEISVTIIDSGSTANYLVPAGSTTEQILVMQEIALSPLDWTDPSLVSILEDGQTIRIIRVLEQYDIEESVLPFEQQTVKNESIAEGQNILIQPGVNGKIQVTYRTVFEDGLEISKSIVKTEVIITSKPEIVMIGVQSPFTALNINGVVAYISSSNAWIMEENTGNRRIIVSTGDLDGRVFSLSSDGKWLLFSRVPEKSNVEMINELWLVDITSTSPNPIDTAIRNVVHYADWVPGKDRTFAYSTAEARETPPGWQANNDLVVFRFDSKGKRIDEKILVETNSGGQYGWWGTTFQWSPDGKELAYARPDSIGLVDIESGSFISLVDINPYQPNSDWAWVPGVSWSADGSILYSVLSNSITDPSDGNSINFNLVGLLLDEKAVIPLVQGCGLFCSPIPSPLDDQRDYLVGYLSAITPEQSEMSRYNLKVMDRDGSNQSKLYPGEGLQGLNPQTISWSPSAEFIDERWLAFLAQGNLFFANISSGSIKQVTGDGSITRIIWR